SISNHSAFRNDAGPSEDQSFSLFDVPVLVPVTIISIILFFLGVSGNLITTVIFRRSQETRTTVNTYLSSTALWDMLTSLGLPSDLYRLWKYKPHLFGHFLCKFFAYLSETCMYCTILHITTVSVERYFAICFPLKAKVTITKCCGETGHPGALGLLPPGPILFLFGVEHPAGSHPQESRECRSIERVARTGLLETMTWVSTVYFFPPTLCLTLLYGLICRKLRWGGQPGLQTRSHTQTVTMLAIVILAFVLCWLPFHIGQVLFAWSESILYGLTQYFNLIAMLLFCLGASINPILYVRSHKYRKATSKIL
ncbi:GHSR protein, partial [Trogon melanurus]|nr:GHSR protein [Trogon melanurus]